MEEKQLEKEVEEVKEIRHTISAEETFTLAKDVFDLRCVIKSIYNNRAQISRRLNLVSLITSVVFTLLYVAYMVFGGLFKKLSLGWGIAVYCVLGAYAVFVIVLIAVSVAVGKNRTTKNVKRQSKALKFFRYAVKLSSLAMGIAALALSVTSGTRDAVGFAVDTVAVIISIVFIIFTSIPLLFGGLGGLARWLLSPAKFKRKFSFVILEWYQLIVSDSTASKSTKKVSAEYIDDIGRCTDQYLIPALGKKYMSSININAIYAAINSAPEADKPIIEGIIKNVFSYAEECGYVTVNPCKDMDLQGSIEVVEKPKKQSLTERIGRKVGKSLLSKFIPSDD